ncbi:YjgP/YjgQ family permease [Komarekiella sp. 'clone 1']|uniref:YjgP/YjgQ family permease n=1 Tax=Komarekiella delphini-convector SJRDD-AB1 TaxID=2593771 RepID=A0AA40VQ63_9NOST|nr:MULTISPECIES: LptF/LptG family permease [Nostocaceae]MBD6615989.1 YjgP/YjgQ family permease [Komarekiella delphini-convector SJRDD-AB1]MBW4684814.1 LptF/LptG family permease [Komarekiella atlantica HA4396-MV6]
MDRYLISELLPTFLFGVGAFSSIGVTIDAVFDLVRKIVEAGLPVDIAIQVFLLKLPNFIVLAFPMSTLLATLMTYSRLSSESELIALRGCGVSVYRMVLTAVMMSLVVTGMTFVFNEHIAPAANYQAGLTLDAALKSDKPTFKQQNIFYPEYRDDPQPDGSKNKILTRLFYADQFDGKRMKGLTIIDRSTKGLNQIVVSESAQWNGSQNVWDFYNGTIYFVAPDRSYRNIVRFEHQQLQLPRTPLSLAEKSRDYGEMNIGEALDQLEVELLSGDRQKIRKLQVRIQQKIALPFVCVVFGLVGAAMGTVPQRTGKGTSFGISVIVIFSYYLIFFISGAMGQAGILSPFMGAWLPNFMFLGVGVFLLMRVAKR